MKEHAIFSATLGLSPPWHIYGISLSKEEKRMDVIIDFLIGSALTCSTCGNPGKLNSTNHEIWHHNDFFTFVTYLHTRVPVIECPTCGIHTLERPWARGASQFRLVP